MEPAGAAATSHPVSSGVHLTTQRGAAAAPNPPINHQLPVNEQKSGSAKGSRLAADWTIPNEWLEQSAANHPEFDQQALLAIAEDFRDYWTSKTGAQAKGKFELASGVADDVSAKASGLVRGFQLYPTVEGI